MDDERMRQERARAENHGLRRTLLQLLDGEEERTLPELAAAIPDAGARVVPNASPEAVLAYHLGVLHRAELVDCDDGVYRALA